MTLSVQIAKHIRNFFFGGNWTDRNLKKSLEGLSWQEATTRVYSLNSIAALVFHINYYVGVVTRVLEGNPLEGSDKFSFDLPPIQSQADWEHMLEKTWKDAEKFAQLVEDMPETGLWEDFWENKYGNYYYNLQGIVEHSHYHLGQIALIRKILREQNTTSG